MITATPVTTAAGAVFLAVSLALVGYAVLLFLETLREINDTIDLAAGPDALDEEGRLRPSVEARRRVVEAQLRQEDREQRPRLRLTAGQRARILDGRRRPPRPAGPHPPPAPAAPPGDADVVLDCGCVRRCSVSRPASAPSPTRRVGRRARTTSTPSTSAPSGEVSPSPSAPDRDPRRLPARDEEAALRAALRQLEADLAAPVAERDTVAELG